jgi:hypothetical protein
LVKDFCEERRSVGPTPIQYTTVTNVVLAHFPRSLFEARAIDLDQAISLARN